MKQINRRDSILTLLRQLDITPTMHKYAVERYQAISTYLHEKGIDSEIYPQGSFRLGTVVRPIRQGKETDFDLDIVCEINTPKVLTTAESTKLIIGNALLDTKTYSDRLQPEEDRCWTLKYADLDGAVGFVLDVVPSVHEDAQSIDGLIKKKVQPTYANAAIAITEKLSTDEYIWQDSNPKGYADWFDTINRPFLEYGLAGRRLMILRENKHIYASIEDIPDSVDRSALQRVIQLLKRHRDIHYSKLVPNGWSQRPISAIITTLAAEIAQEASSDLDVIELLAFVSNELLIYAKLLDKDHLVFKEQVQTRAYIQKEAQKWKILNPVNPNDNFADAWDDETAKNFFRWVRALHSDFVLSDAFTDDQYYAILENSMGRDLVGRSISKPKKEYRAATLITAPTKPWKE